MDDIWSLPGPLFYKRAWRLTAYQGVMARRAAIATLEQREPEPEPQPARVPQAQMPQQHRGPLPGSREAIAADRILGQIFSFG